MRGGKAITEEEKEEGTGIEGRCRDEKREGGSRNKGILHLINKHLNYSYL